MTAQDMVKVYELAKELGMDSIALLDKLKSLNIHVKNHMSELKSAETQMAREALRKGGATQPKPSRKAPTKTKKKNEAQDVVAHAPTDTSEKKTASTIIRRRTKTEGGIEPSVQVITATRSHAEDGLSPEIHSAETETTTDAVEYSESHPDFQTETSQVQEQDPASLNEEVIADSTSNAFIEETSPDHSSLNEVAATMSSPSTPSPTTSPTGAITSTPVSGETSHPVASTPSSTPAAAGTEPGLNTSATPVAPQKPPRPPIVLTPRPVAPRRSILKIVEAAAPPPRPIIKPSPTTTSSPVKPAIKGSTTTQDKDGFRIVKMTKENLDQMAEEEAAKKRGGVRELEIRPEDVRFADYRKKERVFLPKKKRLPVGKTIHKTQKTQAKTQKRVIQFDTTITVQELASQLSVKSSDLIRKLMAMGQMVTVNQNLDFDTATLISSEYQYELKNVSFDEAKMIGQATDATEEMIARPPVVTIMGHVDHGKTTLLDSIREANVAGGEAGGITQHIGAYTIEKNGKLITFIDTPGHEAFTVMRARGANVTDVVILVVSADDGVMPQTREAISHAQAAKVPIVVAVNKIDKPGANPEKIKQVLSELNLLAEDWGGDTVFVPVSALKKTNLDQLLDAVLLQAEVLDLKANPSVRASGTILESRLEKGRGAVVSVLIRRGTLKQGDSIVAGTFVGKVKAMSDYRGKPIASATPGIAVEILGFEGVPNASDTFNVAENEADARDIAANRVEQTRAKNSNATQTKMSLEDLFSKIQTGAAKELNVIIKCDAFGSTEAIRDSLVKLSTDQVKVKPLLVAAGGITEGDVLLASASSAIIIGFNVRPETKARQLAEAEHVEIKSYSIIYELLDDVKKAMVGLLDKKKVEKFLGRAEIRQIFTVPKIGTIAGSSVIDGKINRGANVRLLRDSRILYEGKMSSLKRFKDDAKEVTTGFECGIGIENYNDLKPGDIIEAYQIELITPELNP